MIIKGRGDLRSRQATRLFREFLRTVERVHSLKQSPEFSRERATFPRAYA